MFLKAYTHARMHTHTHTHTHTQILLIAVCKGFLCSNAECVASVSRCNDITECLDGSDENNCQSKFVHLHFYYCKVLLPGLNECNNSRLITGIHMHFQNNDCTLIIIVSCTDKTSRNFKVIGISTPYWSSCCSGCCLHRCLYSANSAVRLYCQISQASSFTTVYANGGPFNTTYKSFKFAERST